MITCKTYWIACERGWMMVRMVRIHGKMQRSRAPWLIVWCTSMLFSPKVARPYKNKKNRVVEIFDCVCHGVWKSFGISINSLFPDLILISVQPCDNFWQNDTTWFFGVTREHTFQLSDALCFLLNSALCLAYLRLFILHSDVATVSHIVCKRHIWLVPTRQPFYHTLHYHLDDYHFPYHRITTILPFDHHLENWKVHFSTNQLISSTITQDINLLLEDVICFDIFQSIVVEWLCDQSWQSLSQGTFWVDWYSSFIACFGQ